MNNLELFTKGIEEVKDSHEVFPYVYQFGKKSEEGKEVTVSCGIHGNEICGIIAGKVVLEIAAALDKAKTLPSGNALNVVLACPNACEQNVRCTDSDGNREFDNPDPQSKTAKRIAAIKKFYAVDLMLCLHNPQDEIPAEICETISGKTTLSFAIAHGLNEERKALLEELGVDAWITGPGLTAGKTGPTDSDEYTHSQGGFGVTVEIGSNEKESDVLRCTLGIARMLSKINVFPELIDEYVDMIRSKVNEILDLADEPSFGNETISEPLHLIAVDQVLKGKDFEFVSPDGLTGYCYKNFHFIPAGEVYAIDDGNERIAENDCYIVFPKKQPKKVAPGHQVALLLKAA